MTILSLKFRNHVENLKKKNFKPIQSRAIAHKEIERKVKSYSDGIKELHELYLKAIREGLEPSRAL